MFEALLSQLRIERAHEDDALRQESGFLARLKDKVTDTAARVSSWVVRAMTD